MTENKSLDQDAITGCEENSDKSIRYVHLYSFVSFNLTNFIVIINSDFLGKSLI